MSTMRANTLANLAGTSSPDIVGGELSRARYSLNGTGTIAARDTFNVSSFVDNAVGNYRANFAVAFPNSDYSFGLGAQDASVTALTAGILGTAPAVSNFTQGTYNGSVSAADMAYVTAAFVGDKP